LENIPTGDEFLQRLPASDLEFGKIREASSREGAVLRFVGIIDPQKGIIKAGLEKYVFWTLLWDRLI
jgi:homoserine dehydrogenase